MEQDDFSAEEHEAEDGFLPPDNPAQADLSETEAPARRPGRTVILDSFGNVVRERAQSGLHELSVLTAARNARRILTATVDAIETDGEALPRMVFYVGTVKVMIPFQQMGLDLDPEMTSQYAGRQNRLYGARRGRRSKDRRRQPPGRYAGMAGHHPQRQGNQQQVSGQ